MKKKIAGLLTVFVAIVFLSGCGQKQSQDEQQNQKQRSEKQSNEKQFREQEGVEESFTGSIADLMKRDNALKCEWSMDDSGQRGEGVVYISGENYRQEINLTEPQTMKAYSVSDGEFIYNWTDQAKQGMKMKKSKAESQQTQQQETYQESNTVDINENIDFNCSGWNVDESKFNLPKDVDFIDLDEQINQMQGQIEERMQSQAQENNSSNEEDLLSRDLQQVDCGMCENLPEGPRQSCLESCQ
jgi:outer membrane lipoprotein-sorting protein